MNINKIKMKYLCLCIVFISVLALAGCESGKSDVKPIETTSTINEATVEQEKQIVAIEEIKIDSSIPEALCCEDEVEDNINAVDLDEDQKLTDSSRGGEETEEITVVPGEEITELNEPDAPVIVNEPEPTSIIKSYETQMPDSFTVDLKYSQYSVANNYILITVGAANIREAANASSPKIGTAMYFEKVSLVAEVKGQFIENYGTDIWYEVLWKKGDQVIAGYILSALGEARTFQFKKMEEAVSSLKTFTEQGVTAYISNYKNRSGTAPYYKGGTIDSYGFLRYQSAPAYLEASTKSDFRYIIDGMLVSVIAETDTFYKIVTLNFPGEYFVPKKFVSFRESIKELKKVVVIDRKNQNEGVFEYIDGQLTLVSYIYATTGEKSAFKQPTDLGYFMAIQKVDRFLYLDDITKEIGGYAPYAIRFNGGAYIHGVPVDLQKVNGVAVYPPTKEYLFTIGTIPRSHKCVRNYTSHAKFLHEWADIGSTAVVVIE